MRISKLAKFLIFFQLTVAGYSFADWTERVQLLCELGTQVSIQKEKIHRSIFIKALEFSCESELQTLASEVRTELGVDLREADLWRYEERAQELIAGCENGKKFSRLMGLLALHLDEMSNELMDKIQQTFDAGLNSPAKKKFDLTTEPVDEVGSDELHDRQNRARKVAQDYIQNFDALEIFDRIEISPNDPDFSFMIAMQNYFR